jgi:hypothetical protein
MKAAPSVGPEISRNAFASLGKGVALRTNCVSPIRGEVIIPQLNKTDSKPDAFFETKTQQV